MALSLDQLESRIQALIEINLLSFLPGQRAKLAVVQQLATAIQTAAADDDQAPDVPDVFTLVVNPDSASTWRKDPKLLEELAKTVRTVAEESGLQIGHGPTLSIATDNDLGLDEVRVLASHRMEKVADTQAMQQPEAASEIPPNAFVIIGGVKVFPLKQSVINIGRRADNNLVLDDPRISRYHAQIRANKGHFVLFDLNSTGGTYVNGQRVNQTVLYPGDVISLAGLPLIFGQDNPPPFQRAGDTGPISISASERATAILRNTTGSDNPTDQLK